MKKLIIRVDIDDTICRYNTNEKNNLDYSEAIPINENIQRVNDLYDKGHTIIYWTARGALTKNDWTELTRNQLNSWGCKYHELYLDKPFYDAFVDDRCVNDFDQLEEYLKKF